MALSELTRLQMKEEDHHMTGIEVIQRGGTAVKCPLVSHSIGPRIGLMVFFGANYSILNLAEGMPFETVNFVQ